jgi:hypothetical protein
MASVARNVLSVAVLFLGLALSADAEKCASGESIRDTGCACAAGFRVDEKRTYDGDGLWETVRMECLQCPPGTFSGAGDTLCAPCAVATFSNAGAAACTTDQFLASHAPGVFACAVIGLVGAVLNSLAILVLFLWVRGLKSVVTQTDVGAV